MSDTVVACATPWGHSAVALLRLSGDEAGRLARELCPGGPSWHPRRASLRRACDGPEVLDELLVTWMPGPGSYTGEDVVELTCHGNPVVVERVLDRLVALGARPARPGEFTRRALEHGRMDLLEAEAVVGLVEAGSWEGVRLARAGVGGQASGRVNDLRNAMLDLASELEAWLDHPEGDLARLSERQLVEKLDAHAVELSTAAQSWRGAQRALRGTRVALLGPVNAGKSSLFNRLVKERRALVSATPGTTRDVVERAVLLKGRSITFFDTAGERSTPGPVEVDGLELAHSLLGEMDLVLVVVPLHRVPDELELAALDRSEGLARLRVGTHLDLLDSEPSAGRVDVAVSNATGEGLADLQEAILLALVETPDPHMTMVATSQRQHELFGCMAGHLGQASEALTGHLGPAVAAEEVTRALLRLDELTGVDAREGVLDRLFSRFCIGK